MSLVEFGSVLAMKVQTGVLDGVCKLIALRRFRADIVGSRIAVG